MSITSTYISPTSFSIIGDKTAEFNAGRRNRTTYSGSNYSYGTVVSSSYSSPNTTVTIEDDTLNSAMLSVEYGVQSNTIGSLPEHSHDSTEGEGGELISDTAYSATWSGVSTIAPSKGVVYDKIDGLSSFHDYTESPILVTGGSLSEGTVSGTLKVGAITAVLRDEDSETGSLVYVTKDAEDNIELVADDTTYLVVLNYNSGTPTITLDSVYPNLTQNINIGLVHNNTDTNSFLAGEGGFRLHNFPQRAHLRDIELRASELASGSIMAYSGTNNFTMTAGVVYSGLNRVAWSSYDSVTDKFTTVYRASGEGLYTLTADQTTIDYAHFDDGDGTLGSVGSAKYGVYWVYRTFNGCVYVVYGYSGSYGLEAAENAEAPLIPDFMSVFGLLVGKIITPNNGGSFSTIQMVTDTFFSGTATTAHNDLGGLNNGDYKHLTATEYGNIDGAATATSNGYATSNQIDKLDGIADSADVTGSNTPQAHDLDSHNSCTLAELSADLTDATLIDTADSRLSDARTPTSHESSHEYGGMDELDFDQFADGTTYKKFLATERTKLTSVYTGADVTGDNVPQAHTHDDRYYTETEVDSSLAGKSDTSHTHDTRYYTETEIDTWRSSTTQTEMGYVHGVTSDIQTQLGTKLSDVSDDTSPSLGGELSIGEYGVKLDSLLSADGKYSGIVCDGVLGATLAYGDLVYLNTTDQRWELADADAEATAGDVMLAIVLSGGVDGNTRLLLLRGFVREDDWNFTSYGQALFVSTTAGDMSQTAPSATGDVVRVLGYAGTTADQIYFSPDNTWIEIS